MRKKKAESKPLFDRCPICGDSEIEIRKLKELPYIVIECPRDRKIYYRVGQNV